MNAVIDASAQVGFASDAQLREYLPATFRTRGWPAPARPWYQAPGGEFRESTYGDGYPWAGGFPGSDPERVVREVLDEGGARLAVLQPRGRGNLPDWTLNTEIYAATNRWLAERFLDPSVSGGRFRGTVLVNPEDPDGAIREIRRWSGHPGVVQVGVPLQSQQPYGKPQFQPIWRAAAEAGLAISVHISAGSGIERAPSPAGHMRTFAHYAAYMPLNYFHHLSSLIMDGTLARIPDVRFVFADGGSDILTPLIWRLDTFWRSMRDQTPWVRDVPSSYLADHVRFVVSGLEGPDDPAVAGDWLALTGKDALTMYGSNYPYWSSIDPGRLPDGYFDDQRRRILHDTAAAFYGLPDRRSAGASPGGEIVSAEQGGRT